MPEFEKILQLIGIHSARALEIYARFNETWREGANRRTLVILFLVGGISVFSYLALFAPPEAFPVDELVEVREGKSLKEISQALDEGGVVRSSVTLRIIVTLLGRSTSVRAGDYLFKEPRSVFSVARAITTGAYGLEPERIRIMEGATVREMARIYATRLKRIDEDRFIREAEQYEGYLFPDTYFFLPNVNEETIIRTMRQNFDAQIEKITGEIASFGKPLSDVVIMASLLEREARIMNDRQMIAGVLWRRINKNMLLQVDAAFLYTLGKGTFQLTRDDLNSDSPYNTYKYKGLPPTPIGSPSLSSLRAAVTPIDKGYLFYLADNHGVTYYSKTYEEHLAKKRLYLGG